MNENIPVQAYDVNTFCKAYSVGRTLTYAEIKAGRLKITKVGRRTLIPAESAKSWLENHKTQSQGT